MSTFKQSVVLNRTECFEFRDLETGDMTRSISLNFDGVLSQNMFISVMPIKRVLLPFVRIIVIIRFYFFCLFIC